MDIEKKPRRLRIVTGPIAEIEEQLNRLLDDYMALVWTFAPLGDQMHGTVVMIHASELRKQQLAQMNTMGRRN